MKEYFDKETVNALYPGATMIPPMLIWKLGKTQESKLSEICNNNEYYGEVKKDGVLYELNLTTEKDYLFGRTVSKKTGVLTEKSGNIPHIIKAFRNVPKDTVILGELYYHGKTSKDVVSITGCLAEKAIARQKGEYGYLDYYIYDVLKYKGWDLTEVGALERKEMLTDIYNEFLIEEEHVEMAETLLTDLEDHINNALASGEEGVVLKKKTGSYVPNKRPAWNTVKIKKVDTLDVVCMGFGEPTKLYSGKEKDTWKYWELRNSDGSIELVDVNRSHLINATAVTKPYFYGWYTAINVGAYNDNGELVLIGSISSGLNDVLRADMGLNPTYYLDRVAKIQCMELDKKDKTIRHGFFVDFRDDKDAEECLMSNIFK